MQRHAIIWRRMCRPYQTTPRCSAISAGPMPTSQGAAATAWWTRLLRGYGGGHSRADSLRTTKPGQLHVCRQPLRPDGVPLPDERAMDALAPGLISSSWPGRARPRPAGDALRHRLTGSARDRPGILTWMWSSTLSAYSEPAGVRRILRHLVVVEISHKRARRQKKHGVIGGSIAWSCSARERQRYSRLARPDGAAEKSPCVQ